jgi:hypothetical protein
VLWWFLVIFLGSTIAGVVAGTKVCEAQQIVVDTTTEQYRGRRAFVDSVGGIVLKWSGRVPLSGWRIVLRADTLTAATAQTRLSEAYRTALIVVDLRSLDAENADEAILHELFHLKIAAYTSLVQTLVYANEGFIVRVFQRAEEALVTDLTRAMLWR